MGMATTELTPVEQTVFLTEYARALDSRWPRPILGDTLANDVIGKIDYDFAGLGGQTSVVCQTALRAKMLDDRVRQRAVALGGDVTDRSDLAGRHPGQPPDDAGRGRPAGVQRLRRHRLVQPVRDQALPAEDVLRCRESMGLRGIQGHAPSRDVGKSKTGARKGRILRYAF
jgi:hypothetical protein